MKIKVFLDVDGILTDFNKSVLEIFKVSQKQFEQMTPKGDFWWDKYIVKYYYKIIGLKYNENNHNNLFWRIIYTRKPNFWQQLPKTEDGDSILELLEKRFGKENICLLTSPPVIKHYSSKNKSNYTKLDYKAALGKTKWIIDNYPDYQTRFLIGVSKHFLADPYKLLVDDADHNIDAFHQANGNTIMIPRYWNRLHNLVNGNILDYLDNQISQIINPVP